MPHSYNAIYMRGLPVPAKNCFRIENIDVGHSCYEPCRSDV